LRHREVVLRLYIPKWLQTISAAPRIPITLSAPWFHSVLQSLGKVSPPCIHGLPTWIGLLKVQWISRRPCRMMFTAIPARVFFISLMGVPFVLVRCAPLLSLITSSTFLAHVKDASILFFTLYTELCYYRR